MPLIYSCQKHVMISSTSHLSIRSWQFSDGGRIVTVITQRRMRIFPHIDPITWHLLHRLIHSLSIETIPFSLLHALQVPIDSWMFYEVFLHDRQIHSIVQGCCAQSIPFALLRENTMISSWEDIIYWRSLSTIWGGWHCTHYICRTPRII